MSVISETMVIVDVWGGRNSMDHVARHVVSRGEAMQIGLTELDAGFLVNLRTDPAFATYKPFDERLAQ